MSNSIITFFALIIVFFSSLAFPAQVKINGSSEAYKGSVAELIIYEDFFSLKEKIIATDVIGKDGKFVLEANINQITKAFIRIDNVGTGLFLEPGNTYVLVIPGLPIGKEVQGSINFIHHRMVSSTPGHLNGSVLEFNTKYDKFIEENYPLIVTKAARPKIEEFKAKMAKEYMGRHNNFLSQYVEYSLASLSQLGMASRASLYKNFIKGKPVLCSNPEYMNFIKEFFNNHLLSLSQSSKGSSVADIINNRDLNGLLNIYKTDSMLAGPQLRELVLIKGLQEVYHNKAFKKASIAYLLKNISEKTIYPEHKLIANNVLWLLTRFDQGQKAPEFELTDLKGEKIGLEQLKGKYVYLNFWATWCTSCINDLRIMKGLQEKYQQNIVFVSVSTDKRQEDFIGFIKKNPYSWNFAHFSTDKRILDAYAARGLPIYYLISPDGRFVEAPALSPSENVEKMFQEITKPLGKKHKVGERN